MLVTSHVATAGIELWNMVQARGPAMTCLSQAQLYIRSNAWQRLTNQKLWYSLSRHFSIQCQHISAAECVDLVCAWITQVVNPDWLQLVVHYMGEEDRAGHNVHLR